MTNLFFFVSYSTKQAMTTADGEGSKSTDAKYSLTLNPEVNEVSGQGECSLKVNQQYVKLKTKEYYEDFEMRMTSNGFKSTAVLVKVDDELREKLNALECEVKKRLPSGFVYKPLYQGANMTVKLSPFCKYYRYDDQGKVSKLTRSANTEFKQGHYVFIIRVPSLYVGPHRNGEHCSLSLDIDEVYYRPDREAIAREKSQSPWEGPECRIC